MKSKSVVYAKLLQYILFLVLLVTSLPGSLVLLPPKARGVRRIEREPGDKVNFGGTNQAPMPNEIPRRAFGSRFPVFRALPQFVI